MISYKGIKYLLIEADLKMIDLIDAGVVTRNNSVTINNDRGFVTLATVDSILNYLSNKLGRTVAIGELIEFTPDQQDQGKDQPKDQD